MLDHLQIFSSLENYLRHRKGEVKLGERLKLPGPDPMESLKTSRKNGVRFVLLGIPESFGIQANMGIGGAERSWEQFLLHFANLQSNRFLDGSSILCLGQVKTQDLQNRASELDPKDLRYFTKLRSLCLELDQRAAPIIEQIGKAGLIPIVIGGGHNNTFPILKGLTKGLGALQGIGCINIDAHADFRPLEGRHSGNGFSYAYYQGYLQRYYVFGLNDTANSEAMLKNMDLEEGVGYQFFQPGEIPDISAAIDFVRETEGPVGLEIDLDAIAFMPASAYGVSGYSLDQVRVLIKTITGRLKPAYLHLTEGQVTDGPREGQIIGKTLSTLVLDFVKSCLP